MNFTKKISPFFILLIFFSLKPQKVSNSLSEYNSDYVQISSVSHEGEEYKVIYMKRKDYRVRAKYFAYKLGGNNVYYRYNDWKTSKDVIMLSSGTYMDSEQDEYGTKSWNLVGLTIDQGKIVNEKIERGRMEGLVIVYPHGGIDVFNISDGNFKLKDNNGERSFNLLTYNGLTYFKKWAVQMRATVFQTHLLAWNNELNFKTNYYTKPNKRERRFLAIGESYKGEKIHCIIHKPEFQSLYESSNKVLNFLRKRKRMKVLALLNLDTGMQDVCEVYTKSGALNNMIKGHTNIQNAQNLLVYYFQ